jgi:hypothetical protein
VSAEIAGMRAAGALRKRSGQKPRFLTADNGVMSAEIAGSNFSQSIIVEIFSCLDKPSP